MPWKKNDYPASMKHLDPRVRGKAIEIANALLEEGYEEGRAIAIATAQAKRWNDDHPLYEHPAGSSSPRSRQSNIHVVPDGDGWAVKKEGAKQALVRTDTKLEAVDYAKQQASDSNKSAIIHRQDGTVETSYNYS
ncbi:DUF2188 domain-containing protein [Paenibacillus sp. OAS669]|uniref:DUF2188 domain-containing protein n=1 Tax=Paenibacillus sp. OAS669 TaxID=2663821 RepID=UPI00178B9420|nr:DUF2188 domain-containing protein [Paenibacillus sp. OAS669]MBE1442275.1 uncharacterized protein YdaT [Paenibacillus sp. OAS669]